MQALDGRRAERRAGGTRGPRCPSPLDSDPRGRRVESTGTREPCRQDRRQKQQHDHLTRARPPPGRPRRRPDGWASIRTRTMAMKNRHCGAISDRFKVGTDGRLRSRSGQARWPRQAQFSAAGCWRSRQPPRESRPAGSFGPSRSSGHHAETRPGRARAVRGRAAVDQRSKPQSAFGTRW